MKANYYSQFGSPDVIQFKDVEKPVYLETSVLVKVHAASLNAYDWRMMRANPFMIRLMGAGLFKPKQNIPGVDFSGEVIEVGSKVTKFKPGDQVFGSGVGSFAEFAKASESSIAIKPEGISFEDAAAVPMAALTALQGLRDYGKIQEGQKVLINGASGGVGSFAVQIAKAYGAEVTAVCSAKNAEMVQSIGADFVIDYKKEDFTKSNKKYDLIFVANGYHGIFDYLQSLNQSGIYVVAGGPLRQLFQAMLIKPFISLFSKKRTESFVCQTNTNDLQVIAEMLKTSKVKPVIDKCYQLNEVQEAIRYMENEHARGKIVITN